MLKTTIRPEFLNRIDDIIMFKPLSKMEISRVVRLQFAYLQQWLQKSCVEVAITDRAVALIADKGYDPQFGARPVKRVIQRDILNEMSKMILAGKISKESTITVDASEGQIVFTTSKGA
jgi:ATP-dependent Clp protease ATP-binding subunit ClpB